MFNIGTKEIIIIAALVVLFFGGKKIPELSKGIAESIRHIRDAVKGKPSEDSLDKSKE